MFGRKNAFSEDLLQRVQLFFKKFFKLSYILLLLSVLLLMSVNYPGMAQKFYDLGYNAYGESVKFVMNSYESFFKDDDLKNLQIENFRLKQQNEVLSETNQFLKSKINLIDNRKYKYITAMVTQVTHPNGEAAFIISAGSQNGVKIGNIVTNEGGIVGRVSHITEKFSVVSLLGNENVKIPAVITPSYQECIVGKNVGDDSLKLTISYLNDSESVKNGNEVISSGKDGFTPFGLKIGKVAKIDGKAFVIADRKSSILVEILID